jgi:hypothetical protein
MGYRPRQANSAAHVNLHPVRMPGRILKQCRLQGGWRVLRSGGGMRQPNPVIANLVGGDEAERRPGAGEVRLAGE